MKVADRIEQVSIDKLTPYARNTRTHSAEQVSALAAAIDEFGLAGQIIIRDGVIAKGHGTLAALRKLYAAGKLVFPVPGKSVPGVEPFPAGSAPVVDATGWTDAQFRAFVVADNRLAELAGWDETMLAGELAALELEGFTGDLLGFSASDLDLIDSGGFDERAQDANAAQSVSDELSSDDDSCDNQQVKPTRSVYPLVLSLNRSQYERWQGLKRSHDADDVQMLDLLMGDA